MTPEDRLEDMFLAEGTALDQRMIIRDCLRAARSEALEEAARVAENCEVTLSGDDPYGNAQIAAAIRALKK